MTDPIPSPRSPQPGPLTPEEEALLRDGLADPSQVPSCARGIAALDILPRVLATLDAERDQWDGLSARAIEAEHALATIRPAVDEFVAAQDANTGDAGADSKRIWNAQTTLRAARLTPIPSPDTDLRAAVASFFDGRRRRAPAAEMLRLTAVMADALNGSSSESTETLDAARPRHTEAGLAVAIDDLVPGGPGITFPIPDPLTETLDAAPERAATQQNHLIPEGPGFIITGDLSNWSTDASLDISASKFGPDTIAALIINLDRVEVGAKLHGINAIGIELTESDCLTIYERLAEIWLNRR